MPSAKAQKLKGTLFHGTHRKHLKSISEVGLVPGVGPMVEWAYGEYMDEEYNNPYTGESMVPELLYFTGPESPEAGTQDESSMAKAFAFVRHAIAYDKYEGDSHKVTWEDIRGHGLLVAVGKDDLPGDLYFRGENDDFFEVDLDWETEQVEHSEEPHYIDAYGTGPEPGDYFSPSPSVTATMVIYGDELVRLGKALESEWPEAMLAGQMLLPLEFRNLIIERHYGPGPHPGTGTPQSVHGGGSGLGEFDFGSPLSRNRINFSVGTMRALRENLSEEQIKLMRQQFMMEVEKSLIEIENALGVPIEGVTITNSLEEFFIHDGSRGFDNPNIRQDLLEIIREKSVGWKGAYAKGMIWMDDTPTAWGKEITMDDPHFHRVLYHEIGHYLTTDLDRVADISSFEYYALMKDYEALPPSREWLVNMEPIYGSNRGTLHREYRADLIASKILSATSSGAPVWARGIEGEAPSLKPQDVKNVNILYSSVVKEFQNKYPNMGIIERTTEEETVLVFFPAAGEIVPVEVSSLDKLPAKAIILDQISSA